MATVRVSPAVVSLSALLPIEGCLLDVLTENSQSYVRDIQRKLVPRAIAVSGYRWHNAVSRVEMPVTQILRYLTI